MSSILDALKKVDQATPIPARLDAPAWEAAPRSTSRVAVAVLAAFVAGAGLAVWWLAPGQRRTAAVTEPPPLALAKPVPPPAIALAPVAREVDTPPPAPIVPSPVAREVDTPPPVAAPSMPERPPAPRHEPPPPPKAQPPFALAAPVAPPPPAAVAAATPTSGPVRAVRPDPPRVAAAPMPRAPAAAVVPAARRVPEPDPAPPPAEPEVTAPVAPVATPPAPPATAPVVVARATPPPTAVPPPAAEPPAPEENVLPRPPSGAPAVRLSFLLYSRSVERRSVSLTLASGEMVTLHEGDNVGDLEVAQILPDRIHLRHQGRLYMLHARD